MVILARILSSADEAKRRWYVRKAVADLFRKGTIQHFASRPDDGCKTNDDRLVSKGLKVTGLRTKRELVDLALRELLRKEDQKSILALEGRFRWEGNLDELRAGRFDR